MSKLYSFARKKPRNPFVAGFILENINQGLFRLKTKTTCCVYELKVSALSYEKLKKVIRSFEKDKHLYKFNVLSLLGFLVKKPRKDRYKKYCAEFIAEVLAYSRIYRFDKPFALVEPDDLRKINGIKKIFEGQLRNYPFKKSKIEV